MTISGHKASSNRVFKVLYTRFRHSARGREKRPGVRIGSQTRRPFSRGVPHRRCHADVRPTRRGPEDVDRRHCHHRVAVQSAGRYDGSIIAALHHQRITDSSIAFVSKAIRCSSMSRRNIFNNVQLFDRSTVQCRQTGLWTAQLFIPRANARGIRLG